VRRGITRIFVANEEGKSHWKDIDIGGRITLEWIRRNRLEWC
jgi:hypothetical protein